MSIATLDAPGEFLPRSKVNEMIEALNALQAAVTGGQLTQTTWVKFNPSTNAILGQGAGIASVTNGGDGQSMLITFEDGFFADANDYAAVVTCTAISGNDSGFASLNAQSAASVQFVFRSDDGFSGVPSIANAVITWNRSA